MKTRRSISLNTNKNSEDKNEDPTNIVAKKCEISKKGSLLKKEEKVAEDSDKKEPISSIKTVHQKPKLLRRSNVSISDEKLTGPSSLEKSNSLVDSKESNNMVSLAKTPEKPPNISKTPEKSLNISKNPEKSSNIFKNPEKLPNISTKLLGSKEVINPSILDKSKDNDTGIAKASKPENSSCTPTEVKKRVPITFLDKSKDNVISNVQCLQNQTKTIEKSIVSPTVLKKRVPITFFDKSKDNDTGSFASLQKMTKIPEKPCVTHTEPKKKIAISMSDKSNNSDNVVSLVNMPEKAINSLIKPTETKKRIPISITGNRKESEVVSSKEKKPKISGGSSVGSKESANLSLLDESKESEHFTCLEDLCLFDEVDDSFYQEVCSVVTTDDNQVNGTVMNVPEVTNIQKPEDISNTEPKNTQNRIQNNIVIVTDERNNFDIACFDDRVTFFIVPGLKLSSAFAAIKLNLNFGKGTIFVIACGTHDLLSSVPLQECLNSKYCSKVLNIFELSHFSSDSQFLVTKAKQLNMEILKSTKNDIVVFCGLIPVDINQENKFLRLNRSCRLAHNIEQFPSADPILYSNYLDTVDCFNNFASDHAKEIGYKAWDLDSFHACEANLHQYKLFNNLYAICMVERDKIEKEVKSKCIELFTSLNSTSVSQISKPMEIPEKNRPQVQTSVTVSAKIHSLYAEDVQNLGNLQKDRVQNNIVLVTDDRDTFDVTLVGFDKRVDVLKVPKLALNNAYDSIANHKSFGKGTIYIFTCGIHDLFDTISLDDCLNARCHCPPMMLNLSANIVDPEYLIKNALKLSKEILEFTSNDIAIFSGLIPVAINQFNKTTYNSRQCLKNHLAKPSPNVHPSKYNEYNSAIDWYNKFIKFYAKTIGEIPWDLETSYFNTGRPLNILLPNGYDLRPNEVLKRLNKVKSLSKGLMLKLSAVAVSESSEEVDKPGPVKKLEEKVSETEKEVPKTASSVTSLVKERIIKKYSGDELEKVGSLFQLHIKTILDKLKGRTQNNIVIVTDERDTFETKLASFDSRVSVVKIPGLKLGNAFTSVKINKNYNNGTLYVFICGTHDLLIAAPLKECLEYKCSPPHSIMNLPPSNSDSYSLIKKALKLNLNILHSTQQDNALFCGLIPVDIDKYNNFYISKRKCILAHEAQEIPNVDNKAYNDYTSTVKMFNDFTKFHAQALNFAPWDLEVQHFSINASGENKNMLHDGFNIGPQEEADRLDDVKFLCSHILKDFPAGFESSTLKTEATPKPMEVDDIQKPVEEIETTIKVKEEIKSVLECPLPILPASEVQKKYVIKYSDALLERVSTKYHGELQKIMKLMVDRVQKNIVILTDERDHLDVEMFGFNKNVEIIKTPGMKLANAFSLLKTNRSFGKGTIFIFICGTHDLIHSVSLLDCLDYHCPCPQTMLTIPPSASYDTHYLIKSALQLNLDILLTTQNDIALFCGLIPVRINMYNEYILNNRPCFAQHPAFQVPNVDLPSYSNYRTSVQLWNDFSKYHAQSLDYQPWDLETAYFDKPKRNILLPNMYNLRQEEAVKRANHVKSLASELLRNIYSSCAALVPKNEQRLVVLTKNESQIDNGKLTLATIDVPDHVLRVVQTKYYDNVDKILKLQRGRIQNNIVIVTDDRENFDVNLTGFNNRVTVLRKPGLKLADAFSIVKMHHMFGKGTVFVFSCGTHDMLQSVSLADCLAYQCPYPQTMLTIPPSEEDSHYLIKKALQLNIDILLATDDDIALFCGVIPVRINHYNSYATANRACHLIHAAVQVPNVDLPKYTKYRETCTWFNNFTKYHAATLSYKPWGLEQNFFSKETQRTVLLPNCYNLTAEEETRRANRAKERCKELLQSFCDLEIKANADSSISIAAAAHSGHGTVVCSLTSKTIKKDSVKAHNESQEIIYPSVTTVKSSNEDQNNSAVDVKTSVTVPLAPALQKISTTNPATPVLPAAGKTGAAPLKSTTIKTPVPAPTAPVMPSSRKITITLGNKEVIPKPVENKKTAETETVNSKNDFNPYQSGKKYTDKQLENVKSTYSNNIQKIIMLQKGRKQDNIVIVTDQRDNFEISLAGFVPKVEVLKIQELKFLNILPAIRKHPKYGKGTIFVISCGTHDLLMPEPLADCKKYICRTRQNMMTLPSYISDFHYLIKKALELHMNILRSTKNDTALFSGLLPVLINEYNKSILSNRPCSSRHPAPNVPYLEHIRLSNYQFVLQWYNEFTKFHAQSLGYTPWDLEMPFFVNTKQHSDLLPDGYSICEEERNNRANHVKFLCSELLHITFSLQCEETSTGVQKASLIQKKPAVQKPAVVQKTAVVQKPVVVQKPAVVQNPDILLKTPVVAPKTISEVKIKYQVESLQKEAPSKPKAKFDRVTILADRRYMPFLEHLKKPEVLVLADQQLEIENLKEYIEKKKIFMTKKTLYLIVIGIHSVTKTVTFNACNYKCRSKLDALNAKDSDDYKSLVIKLIKKLYATINFLKPFLPEECDFAILPPLPVSLISHILPHPKLHDYKSLFPDYLIANGNFFMNQLYQVWMDGLLTLSNSTLTKSANLDPSVLKCLDDDYRKLKVMECSVHDKPSYYKWKEVASIIVEAVLDHIQPVASHLKSLSPQVIDEKSDHSAVNEKDDMVLIKSTVTYDHLVFIGHETSLHLVPDIDFCSHSKWVFDNILDNQTLITKIDRFHELGVKKALFILISDISMIGIKGRNPECSVQKCFQPLDFFMIQNIQSSTETKVKTAVNSIKNVVADIKKFSKFQLKVVIAPFTPRTYILVSDIITYHSKMHEHLKCETTTCFLKGNTRKYYDDNLINFETEWQKLAFELPEKENMSYVANIVSAYSAKKFSPITWKNLTSDLVNNIFPVISGWKACLISLGKRAWLESEKPSTSIVTLDNVPAKITISTKPSVSQTKDLSENTNTKCNSLNYFSIANQINPSSNDSRFRQVSKFATVGSPMPTITYEPQVSRTIAGHSNNLLGNVSNISGSISNAPIMNLEQEETSPDGLANSDLDEVMKFAQAILKSAENAQASDPMFNNVYFVGKQKLITPLLECNVKSTLVYHDFDHFDEREIEVLLNKIGNVPERSACCLVLDVTVIASKLVASAGCYEHKCAKPLYVSALKTSSLNSSKAVEELDDLIYNKLQSITEFIVKLSQRIAVIVMPLIPTRIYCDEESSLNQRMNPTISNLNHKLSHTISDLGTCVVYGSPTLWRRAVQSLNLSWSILMEMNNQSFDSFHCVSSYIGSKPNNFPILNSLNDFIAHWTEPIIWKALIEAMIMPLILGNRNTSKWIRNFRTADEASVSIHHVAPSIPYIFMDELLKIIDPKISIAQKKDQTYTLRGVMVRNVSLISKLNNCRVGGTMLRVSVMDNLGCDVLELKLLESLYVSSAFEKIYKKYKSQIIGNLAKEIDEVPDVATLKSRSCDRGRMCKGPKVCPWFHGSHDKRRNPFVHKYTDSLCMKAKRGDGLCREGVQCRLSHNPYEVKFHPVKYQMNACPSGDKTAAMCNSIELCPYAHKYSPERFFIREWEDLCVIGVHQTVDFFAGAIRAVIKVPDLSQTNLRVLLISPSAEFLDVIISCSSTILKTFALNSCMVGKNFDNPENCEVLLGEPGAFNSVDPKLFLNMRGAIIVDDMQRILENEAMRNDLQQFLKLLKTPSNNIALNKVFVSATYDQKSASSISEFIGFQPKLLYIPDTDFKNTDSTTLHDDGKRKRDDLYQNDRHSKHQRRSRSRSLTRFGRKRSRSLTRNTNDDARSAQGSRRSRSRSLKRNRSSRSTSRSRIAAHRSQNLGQHEKATVRPTSSKVDLARLRNLIGLRLYDQYTSELNAIHSAFEENYAVYRDVPELHPNYETYYQTFADDYVKKHGYRDDQHKEKMWKLHWKNKFDTIKIEDWQSKELDLSEEYKRKVGHPSVSSAAGLNVSHFDKGNLSAFEEALCMLERVCVQVPYLGQAVKAMITTSRNFGTTTREAYNVFTDPEAVSLLNLISEKLVAIRQSTYDDTRYFYDEAVKCIPKILNEARKGPPMLPNMHDIPIDIHAIARVCVGKGIDFAIDLIRSALAYEGIANPPNNLVNDCYLKVCNLNYTGNFK